MKAFRALVRAELATFSRDKTTLVFTFLFPLLFILIFGALMSGFGEAKEAHIGVVSVDEERDVLDRVVAEIGSLSISRFEDEARLREALLKDDEDFGIVWTGTTLRFLYNAGRLQENSAFEEVARGIASRFNLVRQGITPILAIDVTEIGGGDDATWLDLLLPGILAFSVFSAGLFAVSGHLTGMKQRRLLDRLIVTPMRPIALLAAIVVVRLAVVYASTLITLGAGMLAFGLNLTVDWLRYGVFVAAATLGTMGLGTMIALLVRQPSSAGNLASAVSMTMMFLSGIYFPLEIMPAFLRAVAAALPLTYMAEAMRYVTGVLDMAELRFWAITAALFLLGVALLPVLARYVVAADRR